MTLLEFLRDLTNFQDYSRKSRILLIAYYLRQHQGVLEFSANDIKKCCSGVIKPPSALVQQLKLLARGKNSPLANAPKSGFYSLAMPGLDEVESYLSARTPSNADVDAVFSEVIPRLGDTIAKLTEENRRRFMEEAISCLGVGARRATVLMVWAGTVDHLYDYVHTHKRDDFNAALHKRPDKPGRLTIATKDDFSDMKESVFIEVCRSARIISGDVRKILDQKLDIRNTYAHAASVEIGKTKVVDFIEDLVDNVMLKYPI
jgi:hypothetical protein